jgi:hypothetical protein
MNCVTRAGTVELGASHLSTSKRNDFSPDFMLASADFAITTPMICLIALDDEPSSLR